MFRTQSTLSLGRVFGIELRLHWSLFVVFSLILMNLAIGVFPAWHPNWGHELSWLLAMATTLLFFASIVVHELSHALVARKFDIPVSSVTLFLFGGVADLEEDPDSPLKEGLMAGVGPVVSVLLGIAFILLASLLVGGVSEDADPARQLAQMGPVASLLAWLGPINIFIGLFNALPGFPLDGGRVLRAILWRLSGDLERATRWAIRSGQVLGGVIVVAGVMMALGYSVPPFGGGFGSGIWLILIGWFLFAAAAGSYGQVLAREALRGRPVSSLMRSFPAPVLRDISIDEWVLEHVLPTGADYFVAIDENDDVVGIVRSEAAGEVLKEHWAATPISAIVESVDTIGIEPSMDAYDALRKLVRSPSSALPVVDAGRPVGVFGLAEVRRWLRLTEDNRRIARSTSWGEYVPPHRYEPR